MCAYRVSSENFLGLAVGPQGGSRGPVVVAERYFVINAGGVLGRSTGSK